MKKTYRRSGGITVLVAAAAIALAACGGGPSSPHVASLGTSTTGNTKSGGTATTAPTGNATALLNEWAGCMRSNGDPTQADPTVDAYGVINITMQNVTAAVSSEVHGNSGPCSQYELAAENALRAAHPVAPPPHQAQQVKYSERMRANGVPIYPDPGTGGETDLRAAGVDPNSPFVENANKICGKQIGAPAWWIAGTGPPGDATVESCSGVPNCQAPGAGLSPNRPSAGRAP